MSRAFSTSGQSRKQTREERRADKEQRALNLALLHVPSMLRHIVDGTRPEYLLPEDKVHQFLPTSLANLPPTDAMHERLSHHLIHHKEYLHASKRVKFLLLQQNVWSSLSLYNAMRSQHTAPCLCCGRIGYRMDTRLIPFSPSLVSPSFHACADEFECVHMDTLDIRLCELAHADFEAGDRDVLCQLLIRTASASMPELHLEFQVLRQLREDRQRYRCYAGDPTDEMCDKASDILSFRLEQVTAARKKDKTFVDLCAMCDDGDGICWSCAHENRDRAQFPDEDSLEMYAVLHARRRADCKFARRTREPLTLLEEAEKEEEEEEEAKEDKGGLLKVVGTPAAAAGAVVVAATSASRNKSKMAKAAKLAKVAIADGVRDLLRAFKPAPPRTLFRPRPRVPVTLTLKTPSISTHVVAATAPATAAAAAPSVATTFTIGEAQQQQQHVQKMLQPAKALEPLLATTPTTTAATTITKPSRKRNNACLLGSSSAAHQLASQVAAYRSILLSGQPLAGIPEEDEAEGEGEAAAATEKEGGGGSGMVLTALIGTRFKIQRVHPPHPPRS